MAQTDVLPTRYAGVRSEPYGQVIGGEHSADGSAEPLIDPATGERFADWCEATDAEVDRAIGAARSSFDSGVWRRMPPARRAEVLDRAAALLAERGPEIIAVDCFCTGKSIGGA